MQIRRIIAYSMPLTRDSVPMFNHLDKCLLSGCNMKVVLIAQLPSSVQNIYLKVLICISAAPLVFL